MNIGSSFTHPHVVPNLDDFVLLLKTKISLKKTLVEKQLMLKENSMEVNTLKNAGLFQSNFGSNVDKLCCWVNFFN